MAATYPDAYVKDGRIYDLLTDEELPSFTGLVLANLSGHWAIMFTQLDEERTWDLVQWGNQLSTVEINRYIKDKNNEYL